MSIIIYAAIALICFGLGWLAGGRTLSNIEDLTDNLEQAARYVENIETPDIDEMNLILNNNRNTNASLNIQILHHIENDDIDAAKEILINGLTEDYGEIKEDELHDIYSEESKSVTKEIEEHAKHYPSFQIIIKSSQ